MGRQSPGYINVRWSSLECVPWWNGKEMSVEETFIVECDNPGFTNLAESPQLWLTFILLGEHFKLVKVCLDTMQGSLYLLEFQYEQLDKLRLELMELHCVTQLSSATDGADESEFEDSEENSKDEGVEVEEIGSTGQRTN